MFIPLDLSLPIWGAHVTTLTVVANRYEAQGVIVNISGTSPFPRLEYLELDLLDRPLGLTADVIRYLATDSLRRITVRHVIYHRYNFDEGRVLDLVATKFRQIKLDSLLSEGALRRLERLLWNCSHVGVRQFVALGDHIRAMVPNATRRGVFVVEES
ncbi:hypothetical protein K466DRAFT_117515 [Polyporus arcularius HHB13444]|uniref:F-box domain-containing protein n=1 Tax=Polyporus arcularius HHB13444 TaxID=1314778 RepID=A0A5C3PGE8_9APHY|nr:hypothetical protein K466DRAFT_117515 [Polyporus arcularius HHB13444]